MLDDTLKENPLKTSLILSKICVPLMFIQSMIGLFVPGMYVKDGAWAKVVWQANDSVNLFLFVPLLLIAIVYAQRGTDKGKLFWLGTQALVTYNYLYYPLAIAYNKYYLIYVSILGLSIYSLIFGIARIDYQKYEQYIPEKRTSIIASVLMLIFAFTLAVIWIGLSVKFILTGHVDQVGISMISTFDLLAIAAPVVISSIWLLKGQVKGYVILTMMALTNGYCFVLMAYTPFALRANFTDAWTMLPVWVIVWILCFSAAVILMRSKPKLEKSHIIDYAQKGIQLV